MKQGITTNCGISLVYILLLGQFHKAALAAKTQPNDPIINNYLQV